MDDHENFIRMRSAVLAEFDETIAKMDKLKAEGKVKTATYQQLFARKMTLTSMISLYKEYDLL